MNRSEICALIVDDEAHVRRFFALVLQQLGVTDCAEAGSVAEARELHAAKPRALLLLDVNLAGESGLDWLRELRAADDDAVVVMMSALVPSALVKEASELGADGYLRKDMTREELAAELSGILTDTLGD